MATASSRRSPARRIGAEDSATRAALLDAALRLVLSEGCPAVTSRRVAAEAGLKPQLVHYYFRTMDDLLIAVFRRGAEDNLERQARALASPRPLHTLWAISCDDRNARFITEFTALANQRETVRAEFAAYAERFRRLESAALSGVLERSSVQIEGLDADVLPVLMASISRVLMLERTLGVTRGHAKTLALVERCIGHLESDPAPSPLPRDRAPTARAPRPRARSTRTRKEDR